jgi:hypothetical protein
MQTADIFPSFSTNPIPWHLPTSYELPYSKSRVLTLLVQSVGVHRLPPQTSFLFHASLVDATTIHPFAPPLTSHPSIVDAPICHPPPPSFPSAQSIEAATIEVSSEQVVQPSTPCVSEYPSRPNSW